MIEPLKSLLMVAVLTVIATSAGEQRDQVRSTTIEHGELSATFQDNSDSPNTLSGITSLFNRKHAADFDAFDPDAQGASAGLNFEHIISGRRSQNNKFSPRKGEYSLHKHSDGRSVTLVRRPTDSPWLVASTLKYTLRAPHYLDFKFRCTPKDETLFGTHQYAIFFFANYMNDVESVSIHFRGHDSPNSEEKWITADASADHPEGYGGGNYRSLGATDLKYEKNVKFKLNTWSYEWPRIAQPFYYGKARHGMTLILMFDRLVSERDQIRFSLFKFKLPAKMRPAWDFQYVVNKVISGEEYGFRGRLVWKKFVDAEDCLNEYNQWVQQIKDERSPSL